MTSPTAPAALSVVPDAGGYTVTDKATWLMLRTATSATVTTLPDPADPTEQAEVLVLSGPHGQVAHLPLPTDGLVGARVTLYRGWRRHHIPLTA